MRNVLQTPEKITVLYSCACGLVDRQVSVPVRETGVREWMEEVVVPAIGLDHRRTSPECRSTRLAEMKIPQTGRQTVGGPMIN